MMKIFEQQGDFAACDAAERWLCENGYSVGVPQRGAPRGILRGNYLIMKWRNLSPQDRKALDGRMFGDMRNGPVTVEIFDRGAK